MYLRICSRKRSGLSGLGMGDALVTSLAAAIRQVEGYNPAFAGNNNPGNLIFVGQSGATMGAGGFAKFPTPEAGEAALEWQIQNYINRGYDLNQFFNTWAPGGTKNAAGGVQTAAATQNYINTVSSQIGVDPSIPLNSIQGSYGGPASAVDTSFPDPSSTSSGFDFSSLIPSNDQTYDLGAGIVLTTPELWLLGASIVGTVVVFSIL